MKVAYLRCRHGNVSLYLVDSTGEISEFEVWESRYINNMNIHEERIILETVSFILKKLYYIFDNELYLLVRQSPCAKRKNTDIEYFFQKYSDKTTHSMCNFILKKE